MYNPDNDADMMMMKATKGDEMKKTIYHTTVNPWRVKSETLSDGSKVFNVVNITKLTQPPIQAISEKHAFEVASCLNNFTID